MILPGLDVEGRVDESVAKVFKHYGIGSSNLIILSGVFISSLGLASYIDAAAWIITTFVVFVAVYAFRTYVPLNLIKALLVGLAISLLFLLPAVIFTFVQSAAEFAVLYSTNTKVSTSWLAVTVCTPLAIVLLSYRVGDQSRKSVTTPIASLISKNILLNDFFYSDVTYEISFTVTSEGFVRLRFEMLVSAHNRNLTDVTYAGIFEPAGRNPKIEEFYLDGRPLDVDDPDRNTERGFLLSFVCPGRTDFTIRAIGYSDFNSRDSEYISAYRPTEKCKITISELPVGLKINAQSMLVDKIERKMEKGKIIYDVENGFLPHQGLRLFWELDNTNASR